MRVYNRGPRYAYGFKEGFLEKRHLNIGLKDKMLPVKDRFVIRWSRDMCGSLPTSYIIVLLQYEGEPLP